MIFRLLDSDHDWIFGSGKSSYAKDLPAIILDIKTRILSWKNDCYFDLDAGIDWKNLFDYGQTEKLKNAIKSEVLKVAGVLKVGEIKIDRDVLRSAQIEFEVSTIYGAQNRIGVGVA